MSSMARNIRTLPPVVLTGGIASGVRPPIEPRAPKLFSGEGPPPADLKAETGDQYLDTVSGMLYKVEPDK